MALIDDGKPIATLTSIANRKLAEKFVNDLGLKTVKDLTLLFGVKPNTFSKYLAIGAGFPFPLWAISQYEMMIRCPEALTWAKSTRIGFRTGKKTIKEQRPAKVSRRIKDI